MEKDCLKSLKYLLKRSLKLWPEKDALHFAMYAKCLERVVKSNFPVREIPMLKGTSLFKQQELTSIRRMRESNPSRTIVSGQAPAIDIAMKAPPRKREGGPGSGRHKGDVVVKAGFDKDKSSSTPGKSVYKLSALGGGMHTLVVNHDKGTFHHNFTDFSKGKSVTVGKGSVDKLDSHLKSF